MSAEKIKNGKIKSVLYLNIFENLDEITHSNDATHALLTLNFIDFCYKIFSIIEEGKKEVSHFMMSTICFFIKDFERILTNLKTTEVENIIQKLPKIETEKLLEILPILSVENKLKAAAESEEILQFSIITIGKIVQMSRYQLSEYLGNEIFVRSCDFSYLLMLFESIGLNEEKIKLLERNGRKSEVVKELFSNDKIVECMRFCQKYETDPELALLLLKLFCNPSNEVSTTHNYSEYLMQVLDLIMKQNAFPAHFILRILKKNSVLPWKSWKEKYQRLLYRASYPWI